MMSSRATASPRSGGLVGKRRAILAGALTVFARDGYTRASIDAIAIVAGVSTRTIYNHFADKEELFHAVIQDSATQVAEAQVEQIDQCLTGIDDIESGLIEFGLAWATPRAEYENHVALVRQINAELHHISRATVEAWQRTGPQRVLRELAYHMRQLAERGLLRVDDPDRAALHLALLVTVSNPSLPGVPLTQEEITRTVTAGVRTFLHGHLPRQDQ